MNSFSSSDGIFLTVCSPTFCVLWIGQGNYIYLASCYCFYFRFFSGFVHIQYTNKSANTSLKQETLHYKQKDHFKCPIIVDNCFAKKYFNFYFALQVFYAKIQNAQKPDLLLLYFAAHSISIRREGPDEAHQNCADGHRADEGARERPGDAGGPAVQLGQVLHQHARAPQDVAGQHGPDPQQERRSLRGFFFYYLQCFFKFSV